MTKTLEDALGLSAYKDRQPGMVGFAKYIMMQIFPQMKHSHPPFFEVIYDPSCRSVAYLVVHDGASASKVFEKSLLVRMVNKTRQQYVDDKVALYDVFEAQSLLALTDKVPFPHKEIPETDIKDLSKELKAYIALNMRKEKDRFVYINHPSLQDLAGELRSAYARHGNEKIAVEVVVPEGFSSVKEVKIQARVVQPKNAAWLKKAFEEILVKYDASHRLKELGAVCMGLGLPGDWDFNCPTAYKIPTMDGYITANVGANAGPPARAEKFLRSEKK